MKFSFQFFFLLLLIGVNAQTITETNSDQVNTLWSSQGGKIEKSEVSRLYKKNAIAWKWQANSILSVQNLPKNAVKNERSTFLLWIYNPIALKDSLHIKAAQDEHNFFSFNVGLNFKGWRTVWVMFHRDMKKNGAPEQINMLSITPPSSADKGILYFQDARIIEEINPRSPMQDEQVPYVNKGVENTANAHWSALYYFSQFPQPDYSKPAPPLPYSTARELDSIQKREEAIIFEQNKLPKNITLQSLQEEVKWWDIHKINGIYVGKPIFSMNDKEILKKEQLLSKNIKDYTTLMLNIALKKAKSNNPSEKKELTHLFLSLLDYMHYQGWAYGSGMGALHHLGYNFQGYYASCLLMKEEIEAEGLLKQTNEDMYWFSGLGRIFQPKEELPHANLDVFNTILNGMLCSVLMSESLQQKNERMHAFSRWLSANMLPITSIKGAFKPDGAVVHHGTLYPAYGIGGIKGLSEVVYALHGTEFSVSTEAFNSFKNILLTMHRYANPRHWPISLAGRHPTGNFKVSPYPFLMAARAANNGWDKELASAYILIRNSAKDQWTQKFQEKGISAHYPQGHWNVNYGVLDIHRREDWLLTIRGHNRYFVTHESYPGHNVFGRFLTYGHLEVLFNENNKDNPPSHFQDKGWDWSLIPGATTLKLPIDSMRANIINADDYSGVEEMLLSDEVFAGGTNLNNQGLFAMKLHGNDKYNMGSFWANKSWFSFDDIVIALGSDIKNNRTDAETRTTLFQNYLGNEAKDLQKAGDWTQKKCWFASQAKNAYLDSRGIGYIIPNPKGLTLYKGLQDSRDQKDQGKTSGYFETLTLNHGSAPKNARYEYVMKIKTTPKALNHFAKAIKKHQVYEILQQDLNIHSIWYKPLNIKAFSIFRANTPIQDSLLHSVDKPSLIMYQSSKKTSGYEIALTNPDIGFFEGETDIPIIEGKRKEVSIYSRKWYPTKPKESIVKLVLNGMWEISPQKKIKKVEHTATQTQIWVICQYGQASKFKITPIVPTN